MKCERCPRLDGVAPVKIDGEDHPLCPSCEQQVLMQRVRARGGLRV